MNLVELGTGLFLNKTPSEEGTHDSMFPQSGYVETSSNIGVKKCLLDHCVFSLFEKNVKILLSFFCIVVRLFIRTWMLSSLKNLFSSSVHIFHESFDIKKTSSLC